MSFPHMQRRFVYATLAMLAAVTLAGCSGNNRQPLGAAVTLDDKPLAGAIVSFQPAAGNLGGTSGGTTDQNGRLSIAAEHGLMPGQYVVTIQKWQGTGQKVKDPQSGSVFEVTAPIAFKEAGNLNATISAGGANQFEFHLTSVK